MNRPLVLALILGAIYLFSTASRITQDKQLPPQAPPGDKLPTTEPRKTIYVRNPLTNTCFAYESDGRSVENLRRLDCSVLDALLGKTKS